MNLSDTFDTNLHEVLEVSFDVSAHFSPRLAARWLHWFLLRRVLFGQFENSVDGWQQLSDTEAHHGVENWKQNKNKRRVLGFCCNYEDRITPQRFHAFIQRNSYFTILMLYSALKILN